MHRGSKQSNRACKKTIKRLEQIVQELEEGVDPIEVILFGSYARGEQTPTSSIDLLIIAETDLPFIERIKRVIDLISENTIPIDPLVYTPDEIKEKLEESDSFLISAMAEGVLIWKKGEDLDVREQCKKKARESELKELIYEVD